MNLLSVAMELPQIGDFSGTVHDSKKSMVCLSAEVMSIVDASHLFRSPDFVCCSRDHSFIPSIYVLVLLTAITGPSANSFK